MDVVQVFGRKAVIAVAFVGAEFSSLTQGIETVPESLGRSSFAGYIGFFRRLLRKNNPRLLVLHHDFMVPTALHAVRGTKTAVVLHRHLRTPPKMGMFVSPMYKRLAMVVVDTSWSLEGTRTLLPKVRVELFTPPLPPIECPLEEGVGVISRYPVRDEGYALEMLKATGKKLELDPWRAYDYEHVVFLGRGKMSYPHEVLMAATRGSVVAAPLQDGYEEFEGVEWYRETALNALVDLVKKAPPEESPSYGMSCGILEDLYRSCFR